MQCPYCHAQIAYLGEEHDCSYPELSSGDPPTPEDFGGSDEDSHYASSKQGMKGLGYGMTKADTERVMGKAGTTREEAERLHDRITGQHSALAETLQTLQEETLDELRARLVARLDATSWARNEFSDERVAKQVIVVRKDLKMRAGKIGAQIGHAVMKVFLDRVPMPIVRAYNPYDLTNVLRPNAAFADRYDRAAPGAPDQSVTRGDIRIPLNVAMMDWLTGKFTKVCCRVESEAELLRVCDAALKAQLSCALIQDAGLTEFNGVPTLTCCAIGPAYPQDIDPVTGHLKLL